MKRLNWLKIRLNWLDLGPIFMALGVWLSALANPPISGNIKLAIIFSSFVVLYFLTRIFVQNIEDVKYWYRAIYYLLKDGTRGSIIFDRVCYICNDNGTTIEKVPVKHNLEYYSIDKVTDRIIAQQDENIVPPIFDRPSKVNN